MSVYQTKWTDYIVKNPKVVLYGTILSTLILSVATIYVVNPEIVLTGNIFPFNEDTDGFRKWWGLPDNSTDTTQEFLPQSVPFDSTFIYFITSGSKDDTDILTQEGLEAVHDFDSRFEALPGWSNVCLKLWDESIVNITVGNSTTTQTNTTDLGCAPRLSVTNAGQLLGLSTTLTFNDDGELTNPQDIDDYITELRALADVDTDTQFFFDKNFLSTNESIATRMITRHGYPFPGYDNLEDWYGQFYYLVDFAEEVVAMHLEWEQKWNSKGYTVFMEGNAVWEVFTWPVIVQGFTFFFLSFVLVGIIVAVQTRSCCLACGGVTQVWLAFPLATALFYIFFGYNTFSALNIMGLFVAAAVGADDLFVFVDAWKQSHRIPGLATTEARLGWTFRRSAKAMGVTSFTTTAAFLAASVSSIPAIRALGQFTALIVISDYLLVLSLFPAVVVIWHTRGIDRSRCCGWLVVGSSPGSKGISKMVETPVYAKPTSSSLEKFFEDTWAPFIVRWGKQLGYLQALLFVGALVFALQLRPPLQADGFNDFFDEERDFRQINLLNADVFPQSDDVIKPQIVFVWGVADVDTTGVDPNNEINLGETVFDVNFNAAASTAQLAMVELCESLFDGPEVEEDDKRTSGEEVRCPPLDFKNWVLNNSLPYPLPPPDYIPQLRTWLGDEGELGGGRDSRLFPNQNYGDGSILFAPSGDVSVMIATVNMTVQEPGPLDATEEAFEYWKSLEADYNADAPVDAQVFQASLVWVDLATRTSLLGNALFGVFASLILAFFVMLATTCNAWISAIAVYSIATAVASVFAILFLRGSTLGMLESLAMIILVGLSFDYIVHYSNSYNEATAARREGKVTTAFRELGSSVLGGAITSAAVASFLLFAEMLLFVNFGLIVLLAILAAFVVGNTTFMGILAAWGPEGLDGDVMAWYEARAGKPVLGVAGRGVGGFGPAPMTAAAASDDDDLRSPTSPRDFAPVSVGSGPLSVRDSPLMKKSEQPVLNKVLSVTEPSFFAAYSAKPEDPVFYDDAGAFETPMATPRPMMDLSEVTTPRGNKGPTVSEARLKEEAAAQKAKEDAADRARKEQEAKAKAKADAGAPPTPRPPTSPPETPREPIMAITPRPMITTDPAAEDVKKAKEAKAAKEAEKARKKEEKKEEKKSSAATGDAVDVGAPAKKKDAPKAADETAAAAAPAPVAPAAPAAPAAPVVPAPKKRERPPPPKSRPVPRRSSSSSKRRGSSSKGRNPPGAADAPAVPPSPRD